MVSVRSRAGVNVSCLLSVWEAVTTRATVGDSVPSDSDAVIREVPYDHEPLIGNEEV